MRNFDPYKKTILFFLSLLNIILMTVLFSYFCITILQKRCTLFDFTEEETMSSSFCMLCS